ncbi:hypothetical protein Tco_0486986 [Tanacetum coccineum]
MVKPKTKISIDNLVGSIMTQLARLPTHVEGENIPEAWGPEIDTYQAKFKSEFPNKDMKEEFPTGWEAECWMHHNIIDVVDEDDDIIDEKDPIPYDLADSDDEDLVNLDIDCDTHDLSRLVIPLELAKCLYVLYVCAMWLYLCA